MELTNLEKKERVDQIMSEHSSKLADIKQRRNLAIQAFLEKVRQRRIREVREKLSKNELS
jgi:hypothetical protein